MYWMSKGFFERSSCLKPICQLNLKLNHELSFHVFMFNDLKDLIIIQIQILLNELKFIEIKKCSLSLFFNIYFLAKGLIC